MRRKCLLFIITILLISCKNEGKPQKNNLRYILEVNTRSVITRLAGENEEDIFFKKALNDADSLKKINLDSRYSEDFFKVINSSNKISLQKIFINKKNEASLKSGASREEIISFIEKEISKTIIHNVSVIKRRISSSPDNTAIVERLNSTDEIKVELDAQQDHNTITKILFYEKVKFLFVQDYEMLIDPFNEADQYLAKKNPVRENDSEGNPVVPARSPLKALLDQKHSYGFYYSLSDTGRISKLIQMPDVKNFFQPKISFVWMVNHYKNKEQIAELVPIVLPITYNELEGNSITEAHYRKGDFGPEIEFSMDSFGTMQWKRMTKFASESKPQKRIALIIGDQCITAPVVQTEIPNGKSVISGGFTVEETEKLVAILNAGTYGAPMLVISVDIIK